MLDFMRSTGRRLRAGRLWLLAVLALPGCVFPMGGLGPPPVFDGGPQPRTSAVLCDIPKLPPPGSTGCADSIEVGFGMSMSKAAVALVQGEGSSLVLDFSPEATKACDGLPRKIEFQGAFPDGYAVCLNCGTQMPVPYNDANEVCVDVCIDLLRLSEVPGGSQTFCQLNAHVSTNFDKTDCYDNACSSGGTLRPDFVDPRRAQEPVKWTDLIGTATGNPANTLIRTAVSGSPPIFDAGAASEQLITTGDGWVEFEANDNTLAHAVGLSSVPSNPAPPDTDPSRKDIGFALVLRGDGKVYIFESGTMVPGPGVDGEVATYNAGDRFRVRAKDNNDDPPTATITYTKLTAPCVPGTICAEVQIGSQTAPSPSYPLQVDASLRDEGATLTNVTLVRIR